MSKIKTLGILVGILSIVNIGLLIFLFLGIPKGPGPGGFRDQVKADQVIKKAFDFDESQMKKFKESKDTHIENARDIEVELENLSRTFYMEKNVVKRDSLLKSINELSTKFYKNNVKHFDEVRAICTLEQEKEMENFISGLFIQKGNGRRTGKHPPKK